MELTGKIKLIGETQEIGSNGFTKREFVIITDEKYPQHIPLQVVKDKCELLDKFKVGQDVKVSYNINGREWTSPSGEVKHFVTIGAWRIDLLEGGEEPISLDTKEDDLPF